MEMDEKVSVSAVDILEGDVLVSFSDGKSAVYAATLLFSLLDQAEEVVPEERGD